MNLNRNIYKKKISYKNTLMGSTKTVFSHYRMHYFQQHLVNVNKVLLDVGCGAGNKIKNISKNFNRLKIIGIDLSTRVLMYAYKDNNNAFFSRGDAENLPIRDESIDYIISFDLFEHLLHPKKAMREYHRVLKKGSIFHSFIPCEAQKLTIISGGKMFQSLTRKYVGHIQHFTKKQIQVELENVGFTIIDEKHSYFYFAQLINLFSYLLPGRRDRREGNFINLARSLLRILVSKIDLKFSNRFPNHSMGYHITARK